jgi:hypothetical protein
VRAGELQAGKEPVNAMRTHQPKATTVQPTSPTRDSNLRPETLKMTGAEGSRCE